LLLITPVSMIANGSIGYAVFQSLVGQPVFIGKSVSYAASRIFQLIMISAIISVLITLGIALPIVLGTILFVMISAIRLVLIILGMALLIVPGLLILLCMWAIVVPACVVEKLGVKASFSRSASLTKGYRLQILGIFLISFVVVLIMSLLLAPYQSLLAGSLTFLALMFPVSFLNVIMAVMYYRLRAVKEGVAMESLSVVFD
jgi:hypothetical protein